jgi:hypothetical protein
MFAADLYEVIMQRGKRPVYERPENFSALTFPTYNLRRLVRDVVLRLAEKNDKAVRQLELTYGGGKTHTLITLRHLVHEPDKLPNLPAVAEFIQDIGNRPGVASQGFASISWTSKSAWMSPHPKAKRFHGKACGRSSVALSRLDSWNLRKTLRGGPAIFSLRSSSS